MMTTEDVIKELLQESGLGKDAIIVSVNSDLLRRAARDLESLTAENEKLRAENTDLRLAISRLGWDNPDRLISYQQSTLTHK